MRLDPGARCEAVKKSRRLRRPHVSCAAPSALESIVIPNPGLTAGPTHCRLFEAGQGIIGSLVLGSSGQRYEARSAGSEVATRVSAWPGVYTFQTDGPWANISIMAQNPLQTALPRVWIGPSALNRIIVSIPGALPQAGIDRAFGPPETGQITVHHPKQKAPKARTITAWGNAPGRDPTAKGTRAEGPLYRLKCINSRPRA